MADDETRRFVLRRYDSDASFYDALHNPSDDLAFWVSRAASVSGPILECACGTGRVTIPLAREGHSVIGVDISKKMLEVAKSKIRREAPSVRKRIKLVNADFREMELGQKFGLCIIPFMSFHHMLTEEDQLAALKRIRKHLRPGGKLVFNMFNPNLKRPEGVQRLDKVIEEEGRTIMRYSVQLFDRPKQITHGWLIHEFVEADGLVRRKVTPFRLRYNFYPQARRLLKKAGFDVLEVFGGYDSSTFGQKSSMMIFAATPSRARASPLRQNR